MHQLNLFSIIYVFQSNFFIFKTYSLRTIQKLVEEMKVSKNTWARAKMTHFLLIMVTIYPFEGILDRNINLIETFIQVALSDANSEARHKAKRTFI